MTNTEASVLAHHGVPTTGSLVDAARDHGIVTACLGCGSVTVAPEGLSTEDYHASAPWLREVVDSGAWDCCPDADTIVY